MKMICLEAKATRKRDQAINAVVQKYPSSGRKAWANGKSMGRRSTPTSTGMKSTAGPLLTSRSATRRKSSPTSKGRYSPSPVSSSALLHG